MILGLCGLARSGKDSFFRFAEEYYNKQNIECKRFAFADELKEEVDDFLMTHFQLSAFTNNPEEKNIIRPMLVTHGMMKRKISKGEYWINKIEDKAINYSKQNKIAVITDVRFENEIDWINKNGKSIHITKIGNKSPNSEEKENDPKVKLKSLHKFSWIDFKDNFETEGKIVAYNILDTI